MFDVVEMDSNDQMVNFAMKNKCLVCWVFSSICASPIAEYKNSLRWYIQEVAEGLNVPWCLTGDFNQVVDLADRLGGSSS